VQTATSARQSLILQRVFMNYSYVSRSDQKTDLIQTSSTCIKRNLPWKDKSFSPLRFRYSQVSLCVVLCVCVCIVYKDIICYPKSRTDNREEIYKQHATIINSALNNSPRRHLRFHSLQCMKISLQLQSISPVLLASFCTNNFRDVFRFKILSCTSVYLFKNKETLFVAYYTYNVLV
jgi:hypothetical protein